MTAARAWLAAGFLALLFAGLGRLPLLDPDEGRYARTAQEMRQRGDYVVPYLDGQARLKKPVFFYWLVMGAFAVLGENETAARLPSALAAAGTLLWTYSFAKARLGERTALTACAILATTPLFFAMARTAVTDMVLTFFVFGATVSLYAGIVEPVRPLHHLAVAGLCLGFGMLTKGPVALLVPALAVPAALAARRRAPITVAGRAVTVAWVMIAVIAPWTALLFHRVGWSEVLELWRRETLERYASGLDHTETVSYFLLTAPLTFFPWSAFAPFALLHAARRLRRGEGLRPLLLAWAAGGFLFFTLGSGKLDSYLLPLAPAVALLVGASVEDEASRARSSRWAAWALAAVAGALLLPWAVGRPLQNHPAAVPALALAAAVCAMTAAACAFARRDRFLQPVLAILIGATLLGGSLLIPEAVADTRSTRSLVRGTDLRASEEPVYIHRIKRPSLSFYLGRTPTYLPARRHVLHVIAGGEPASVVLEERRREVVVALLKGGFRVASRGGGLVLLRRPRDGVREEGT